MYHWYFRFVPFAVILKLTFCPSSASAPEGCFVTEGFAAANTCSGSARIKTISKSTAKRRIPAPADLPEHAFFRNTKLSFMKLFSSFVYTPWRIRSVNR